MSVRPEDDTVTRRKHPVQVYMFSLKIQQLNKFIQCSHTETWVTSQRLMIKQYLVI